MDVFFVAEHIAEQSVVLLPALKSDDTSSGPLNPGPTCCRLRCYLNTAIFDFEVVSEVFIEQRTTLKIEGKCRARCLCKQYGGSMQLFNSRLDLLT